MASQRSLCVLPVMSRSVGDSAVRRQGAGFSGIHHAGKRLQLGQQLAEETLLFCRGLILPFGKWQPRHQNVVRIESQVHRLQRDKGPHHDSGASQQHQREREFDDHQRIAQPSAPEAAADASAGILQRLDNIAARQLQRRRKPEQQRGEDGEQQAEAQYRQVQPDLRLLAESRRPESPSPAL